MSDNSETDDIKVARAALAGLALLLTVAGQLALQAGPTGLGAGTLLTAMGLLLFIGNRMSPPAEWWVRLVRRLALTRTSVTAEKDAPSLSCIVPTKALGTNQTERPPSRPAQRPTATIARTWSRPNKG